MSGSLRSLFRGAAGAGVYEYGAGAGAGAAGSFFAGSGGSLVTKLS